MASSTAYRREDISIIFAGAILQGFPDGEFFSAERAEEQNTLKAGTHGEVLIMNKLVTHGTGKIMVFSGSQANSILQSLKDTQDRLGIFTFPVLVKDNRSSDRIVFCRDATFAGDPSESFGDEPADPEWPLLFPHLEMRKSGAIIL